MYNIQLDKYITIQLYNSIAIKLYNYITNLYNYIHTYMHACIRKDPIFLKQPVFLRFVKWLQNWLLLVKLFSIILYL